MNKQKSNKGFALVALLAGTGVIVIIVGLFLYAKSKGSQAPLAPIENKESAMVESDDVVVEEEMADENQITMEDYQYSSRLEDVSGGSSSGMAYAKYDTDGYVAYATFENLPTLEVGFFYEGWVVRKSPLDVVSSGVAEIKDGGYMNNFSSTTDLTDHDFYVLTLEPDDGDPAPAEHILEGALVKN